MWNRGEIVPKEQFLLFSTIFSIYLLTSGVKLHIHLLKVVVRFIVFLNSANLICRGTDISKYSDSPLDLELTRVDCTSRICCNMRAVTKLFDRLRHAGRVGDRNRSGRPRVITARVDPYITLMYIHQRHLPTTVTARRYKNTSQTILNRLSANNRPLRAYRKILTIIHHAVRVSWC